MFSGRCFPQVVACVSVPADSERRDRSPVPVLGCISVQSQRFLDVVARVPGPWKAPREVRGYLAIPHCPAELSLPRVCGAVRMGMSAGRKAPRRACTRCPAPLGASDRRSWESWICTWTERAAVPRVGIDAQGGFVLPAPKPCSQGGAEQRWEPWTSWAGRARCPNTALAGPDTARREASPSAAALILLFNSWLVMQ